MKDLLDETNRRFVESIRRIYAKDEPRTGEEADRVRLLLTVVDQVAPEPPPLLACPLCKNPLTDHDDKPCCNNKACPLASVFLTRECWTTLGATVHVDPSEIPF